MRIWFLLLLLCSLSASVGAQSWQQVQQSEQYIWGSGSGATLAEADRRALADLTSKIVTQVQSQFDMTMEERQRGNDIDHQQYMRNCVNTYSSATLTNTERYVLKNEPDAYVGRAIKKSEVDRIFASRRAKAADMVAMGLKAEREGRIDDALRQLYWAHLLTRSLQRPNEATFTDDEGRQHHLMVWIPQHLNSVMEQVKASVLRRQGDDVDVCFTYKDRPVTSLDFTYFDGRDWSPICSARDGIGTLELAEGNQSEDYQLKLEYEFASEAHIDNELAQVMQLEASRALRKATLTVSAAPVAERSATPQSAGRTASFTRTEASMLSAPTALADGSGYAKAMDAVQRAIRQHSTDGLQSHFTPEALQMFQTLLFQYGKARIIGQPTITFYPRGQEVTARGLQLGFQFSKGVRRSFVEDLVLTFNANRKVCNVAFGLGKTAEDDILNKGNWNEATRKALADFLENYKTAYALKRLDYLNTIFDDDAVIIVGNVAKTARQMGRDGLTLQLADRQQVKRTRLSKQEYLRNLRRCFQSQEFINLRFADNDVYKLGKGGETYGIQIAQDYYSTTYGDSGYLFLIVDLNDPTQPIIKVRTWQPDKDPNFGVYSAADFM